MDKNLAKDIKKFSLISNIAFSIIITIFMGVGLGLLLDYLFEVKYWTPICSVLFTIAAIFNFIKMIIQIAKIEDKKVEKDKNETKDL